MRICVDLDGTICETKKPGERYEDVLPMPGAIETLKYLKSRGYYIIIHTARNMATWNNNLGAIIKHQGKLVAEWLEKYEIPYDELLFGKPHVDAFLDDKSIHFTDWQSAKEEFLKIEETKRKLSQ